jgi:type IV pilus assembly protein PilA
MKYNKGFSLLELMMVVCIIGILSAVALPQYMNYMKKGRLTEVINMMGTARKNIIEMSITSPTGTPVSVSAASGKAALKTTLGVDFAYTGNQIWYAWWSRSASTNTTAGTLYCSFSNSTLNLGGTGTSSYIYLTVHPTNRGVWGGTCSKVFIPTN